MRRRWALACLVGAVLGGCDDAGGDLQDAATPRDAGAPHDAGPRPPYVGEHTFPAIELDAYGEVLSLCQSWTLNNPTELWVSAVEMSAGPGWHHSNWMYVPEPAFEGDDGTWRCSERTFNEVAASARGGGVFFAQSTQSTAETQQFPPGAAYRIPPWSRIIGSVHVINPSPEALSSALTFRITTIQPGEVTTRLRPLAIDNRGIELAPRSDTMVRTECNLRVAHRRDLDFSVHYVLPHYHAYADGMRIEIFGGPRDGEVVFETMGGIGNALGALLDPPVDLRGAEGLRTICGYRNEGTETITWGPLASDEMCTMLAYTDAERQFGALADDIVTRTPSEGGELLDSRCAVIAIDDR
ncbi:hypothetical protein [Sandaracinus amylolyticus]|uniref:hypothetical protein n=1 Tax=Sandaracinus amylolyticus TaxID=927083 RepID=UPI001F40402E|nr:hypothetical protein [Sandaracinus amylolyticus]UJR80282.1 Hypothetical protein I5071_23260 [Sandaracinus amylolyticus]